MDVEDRPFIPVWVHLPLPVLSDFFDCQCLCQLALEVSEVLHCQFNAKTSEKPYSLQWFLTSHARRTLEGYTLRGPQMTSAKPSATVRLFVISEFGVSRDTNKSKLPQL